ncbi:MAG: heterocyst formation ABC transporter subunit HepA [Microcoleaceae cyanobacterium]
MLIKQPKVVKNALKRTRFWRDNAIVLRELKHFPRIVALTILFTLLAALFEGFSVGFLLTFLQSLTEPDSPPFQIGIEWFDNLVLAVNAPVTRRIYRISILILLTTLLRTSFIYLSRVYSGLSQSHLVYWLRLQIFDQLQSLPLSYFNKTRSGELVNTATSETRQLMQAVEIISFITVRLSTLAAYVISMLLLSWQLTVVSLSLFGILSVGISTLVRRVREVSFERTRAAGAYTSIVVEFINGIRTVQAFAAQKFESQRFNNINRELLDTYAESAKSIAIIEPLSEAVATTILIGILLFSFAVLIPQGHLQVSALLTFLFILFRLIPIMRQLNGARGRLSNFRGSIENVKALIDRSDKPYLSNGSLQFPGLKQGIWFQAVDFGYSSDTLVLKEINLLIKRGETTALVGASGAGKTTLVDLIPRFHDPTQGQILIDGIDLREFDYNSLRRRLAIVSQDTFIFNTSVRNNIAYAMLQEVDEAEIIEAARRANALEFIQEMSEGFETQLGDRGVRLSGGQRQRIAIARALLHDPEVLILDEATSALDSVSERLIQESIEKLSVGRTVIAIAHRLSTIVRADKVVVLEQGQIVEQGKYQELIEQRGKLWKYHQMQHNLSQVS